MFVHKGLRGVRAIKSVADIQRWLGMSLSEMCKALGTSRSTIAAWKSAHPIPAQRLDALGQIVVNRLAQDIQSDDIGLVVEHSPIRFVIVARCSQCGTWFELTHSRTKR